MEYQIDQEVNFEGQKAIIIEGNDGNGWYKVEVNGKIKDAFVTDINDERIIIPGRNGQIGGYQPGYHSNAVITKRNKGVRHQFIDSIGGCSSNYR